MFIPILNQMIFLFTFIVWMGDSSEWLVGRVYTHFEDDFMYEQMQNVKFEI